MKFLLTRELGRLAKWLRILGFDAEYSRAANLSSLIIQALRDERMIISRNRHLPKATGVRIIFVKSEIIKEQVKEVLKTLNLRPNKDIMFSRCILCNTALSPIDKLKVKDKIPEYVFKTQEDFTACSVCSRVYWRGTHWGNVSQTLEEIWSS